MKYGWQVGNLKLIAHKLLQLGGALFGSQKLNILIYHQVFDSQDPMRPTEPTKDIFRWQMELIKKYYTPISLSEAQSCLKQGTLPSNAICVTFDDGYLNNLTVAAPILEEFRIPATVYIATAFSYGDNMWNDRVISLLASPLVKELALPDSKETISLDNLQIRRDTAFEILGNIKYKPVQERTDYIDKLYTLNDAGRESALMMKVDQVKQLSEFEMIEIGAHTENHPILKVMTAEKQKQEILNSKQLLESWIGKKVIHFAYPNGKYSIDWDETTSKIVEDVGFHSAVVTDWGTSTRNTSAFELKRFTPWDTSPLKFHIRLTKNHLTG